MMADEHGDSRDVGIIGFVLAYLAPSFYGNGERISFGISEKYL
jgi:hypothetical protein